MSPERILAELEGIFQGEEFPRAMSLLSDLGGGGLRDVALPRVQPWSQEEWARGVERLEFLSAVLREERKGHTGTQRQQPQKGHKYEGEEQKASKKKKGTVQALSNILKNQPEMNLPLHLSFMYADLSPGQPWGTGEVTSVAEDTKTLNEHFDSSALENVHGTPNVHSSNVNGLLSCLPSLASGESEPSLKDEKSDSESTPGMNFEETEVHISRQNHTEELRLLITKQHPLLRLKLPHRALDVMCGSLCFAGWLTGVMRSVLPVRGPYSQGSGSQPTNCSAGSSQAGSEEKRLRDSFVNYFSESCRWVGLYKWLRWLVGRDMCKAMGPWLVLILPLRGCAGKENPHSLDFEGKYGLGLDLLAAIQQYQEELVDDLPRLLTGKDITAHSPYRGPVLKYVLYDLTLWQLSQEDKTKVSRAEALEWLKGTIETKRYKNIK